jgi:hypothetical protein
MVVEILAVPVHRYNFGVINWRLEKLRKIDTKTKKMLTINELHHPRANIDRLQIDEEEKDD